MTDVLKAVESPESAKGLWLMQIYRSPIGKKLITGITGLGLALFVLVHMLGNLLLFISPTAYNAYGHHLESWGPLLYLVEGVLLLFVLFHIALGFEIFIDRLRARPQPYRRYVSTGSPSYQSTSSRTMILTGILLAGFLVAHLMTFKFGPHYTVEIEGQSVRDLARLVLEYFRQPLNTVGYSALMLLLGLHLRHGIWSAFQSIGALDKHVRPWMYGLSTLLAASIALGFIVLPVAIYLGWVG